MTKPRPFFLFEKHATILVTTLWILTLLTLLAIGIGVRMGVDIKLISFFLNSSKAHYLAEAGLRKAVALIEADENGACDSLNETWSSGYDSEEEKYLLKDIELGDGTFTVSYEFGKDEGGKPIYLYGASDEEGRLNINQLDGEALAKLPGFTSEIADCVLDWRDDNDVERPEGAESDYYKGLENPYECKNGMFEAPEELLLVKGVTDEIYDGLKGMITAYPKDGHGSVNINTASKEVLAVLIGGDFEELPGKIIIYRNGDDGAPGTSDDRIFTDTETITAKLKSLTTMELNELERNRLDYLIHEKKCFKVKSDTFRILSKGEIGKGRARKTIEAVVKRTGGMPEILYYYEE